MIQEVVLRLLPAEAGNEALIKGVLAENLDVSGPRIKGWHIRRRSIDARKHPVHMQLHVQVWVDEEKPDRVVPVFEYPDVSHQSEVVVVGAGPGGYFAALRLIELGLKPVVLERGKDIGARKRDVALLNRNQAVNPESNYAFGEGGAGTFSDGKLYTRSTKRGDFQRFLEILHFHGASDEILVDAHPHIGTNLLPRIMKNIREQILAAGGEVHFETRVSDFIVEGDRVLGVRTAGGDEVRGGAVILATGHSARDIYELLHQKGIKLEAKTWAMGVRVEHPQELIDQIQYHTPEGRGEHLPAASYSFSCQVKERGVYSFCMCPGGTIVPAMTGPNEMVVNGMSASTRSSPFANSGMVVEVRPGDLDAYAAHGVLAGLAYQREVEKLCYLNGGHNVIAPGQVLTDFVAGRLSADLPPTSYIPGAVSVPLHFLLPEAISFRLREGFKKFGQWAKGFLTEEALVLGTESRTSSPVRIPRDPQLLEHVQLRGLYPCGEGAGYAGGIASSALDGTRCAEMVARSLGK
ncbi:NAD(P)/FAD-dependent oxidoreductase [Geofilum rhodophaeum]|uniref:NAD(P)/FAD-dependent oxidoreductase n=1 Tax=Geofilum rhodophaeum TaxID=1965019 RepID=UPI000B528270|nr:FAD-dependent oxidoreductase [Geofilum rhodophaeum]